MSLNREQPMRPFLEELADAFEGDMPLEYVRTFDTVAEMQAATDLKAGMTCHTNGFHAAGDGGAAYYTIDTTGTANGMDVLALQGGLFATLVVTEPYVTPEMFGAYGDNIHDDATPINRMFASGYCKNYVFSKIEYLCEANVTISTTDNSIAGRGMFTSGIHFADGFGLVVNNARNTISNMRFHGGAGVVCNYHHVNFFRCWFYQAENGITLNDGYITQIVNCHVTFNKVGVLLKNQSFESLVTGCVIDNNIAGVLVVGNTSGPVIRDCTIEGNYNRESGVGCGVFISSLNTRVIIDGCHFEVNGSGQDGVDILEYTNNPKTDISPIINEVSSLYSGSLYVGAGLVTISNSKFTFTKYGIITGGWQLENNISGCYFSGRLGVNNKPILINADLLSNKIYIRDNQVFNADNTAINDEMLSGVKKSYVFTDAEPTSNQVAKLLDGTIWLDSCPLFLYRGRVADLTGDVTYTKIWSSDGTSENGGMVNGNLTNYYIGATTTYISTDGTSAGIAVVAEAGYHEFVLVTNSVGARFNTTEIGWKAIKPNRTGVYPINRNTLVNKNMFAFDAAIVYALIDLSNADIAKMKQCIGFEPTDLDLHEWR